MLGFLLQIEGRIKSEGGENRTSLTWLPKSFTVLDHLFSRPANLSIDLVVKYGKRGLDIAAIICLFEDQVATEDLWSNRVSKDPAVSATVVRRHVLDFLSVAQQAMPLRRNPDAQSRKMNMTKAVVKETADQSSLDISNA